MSHHFFSRLQQIRNRYGLKENELPSTDYTGRQLSNYIKKYNIDTAHLLLPNNSNKAQQVYCDFIKESQKIPLNLNIRATNRSFRQKRYSQNKNCIGTGCEGQLKKVYRNSSQQKQSNYLTTQQEKIMKNGRRNVSINKILQRSGSIPGSVQNLRILQQTIQRQMMDPTSRRAYSSLHPIDIEGKTLNNLNRVQQKIRTYLGR